MYDIFMLEILLTKHGSELHMYAYHEHLACIVIF